MWHTVQGPLSGRDQTAPVLPDRTIGVLNVGKEGVHNEETMCDGNSIAGPWSHPGSSER